MIDKHIKSSNELINKMQNRETLDINKCRYNITGISYNHNDFNLTMDLMFMGEHQEEKLEREFTIDELVFIQGHLGGLRETLINELIQEDNCKRIKVLQYKVDNLTKINKKISELFATY